MSNQENEKTQHCPFRLYTSCSNSCAIYNNDKKECNVVTISKNLQYIRREFVQFKEEEENGK